MNYSLSVEEYILALTLIGAEDAAFSIKEEILPNISEQDLESRLDSATNGLLAQNLLTIDGDQEIVDSGLKNFLMSLVNTPRVVRCQIADGSSLITASVFCGESYKVQQTQYQDRVFRFFDSVPSEHLSKHLDIASIHDSTNKLLVSEEIFDLVIDSLLDEKNLSAEVKQLFPTDFLNALVKKEGRLNTLYDYKFKNDNVTVNTLLYITDDEKTWSIEQSNDSILIKPFSIDSLFRSKLQPSI